MKNFDDFIGTLDEQTFVDIADKINNSEITMKFDLKNLTSTSKSLSNAIAVMDVQITLELLRLYHNWLNS